MNWPLVPQQAISGLLNGGIIALVAVGIVLIYKSSEVFNFAQGHMLLVGALLTWWFAGANENGNELFNLPFGAALILALVFSAVLGFAIERLALRPMTGQPLIAIILMTLGLSQLLEGLASILFGVQPKSNFPAPFPANDVFRIPFSGAFNEVIILRKTLVVAFAAAMLASVAFALFFRFTRFGLSMRATAEDHELARSIGIRVPRVFGASWGIAGIIATLGGVLLAMQSGASLTMTTVVLIAFPAILLGGLESLPGAIVGGIGIGLSQALVQAAKAPVVRSSAEIAPYVLLLIVLILRPEGLFGQKRIERI